VRLNYRAILGGYFLPQPEEIQAAMHVMVRDLAADGQEPARAEGRPRVRIDSKVSSSLWVTSRIAVKRVPSRPSD
jgi:hypothetical protein